MQMRIIFEKPPVWNDCVKAFGEENIKRAVFTFGDTIYNPARIEIPDHLFVHESVHASQQQHDENVASAWYKRYIADPKFRAEQEIEAYGAQYRFICGKVKDRNARFKNLHILAEMCASPMYGKMISYTDAMTKIRMAAGLDKKSK